VRAGLVSDQRRVRLLEQEGRAFVSKTGLASKHIENAQKRYEYDTERYRNNEVVCAERRVGGSFLWRRRRKRRGADMGLLKRGYGKVGRKVGAGLTCLASLQKDLDRWNHYKTTCRAF
jgi:hypothetical protein